MADNIDVTPGSGKTVAADEISGALHQRVKITVGADGSGADMTAGAGAVAASTPRATLASDDPAVVALQLIDDAIVQDDSAYAPGTGKVMMAGFEFDDTAPDTVNEGDAGAARMSANRNVYVNIRDNAGNERGLNIDANGALAVGSIIPGTGATNLGKPIDTAAGATDTGVAALAVRSDAPGTHTPADGDYVPMRTDAKGALWTRPLYQTAKALTNASISVNSSGENTGVSGTASQTVRVFRIVLVAAGPVSVSFKDAAGGTSLTGAMPLTTNGSMILEAQDGEPLFVTALSGAFIINLSAAVTVTGFIQYTKS